MLELISHKKLFIVLIREPLYIKRPLSNILNLTMFTLIQNILVITICLQIQT
jgi:hypothetical protein